MIYEGTNGVQAMDLVGRKLPAHAGRSLRRFFHPVAAFIAAERDDPALGGMVRALERGFGALQKATEHVAEAGSREILLVAAQDEFVAPTARFAPERV